MKIFLIAWWPWSDKDALKIVPRTRNLFNVDYVFDPPEAGLCKKLWNSDQCINAEVRYYFDATLKQCRPFKFGNCLGNENLYPTGVDCQAKCEGKRRQNFSLGVGGWGRDWVGEVLLSTSV